LIIDEGARFAARLDQLKQRWLSQVQIATVDDRAHEAEEEGQKQGSNVTTVDIGIGHDDNTVIAERFHTELLIYPYPESLDECHNFVILEHLVQASPLDV